MKMIIAVVLALVAVAAAAPPDSEAKIVRSEYIPDEKGGYNFGFETDTGITRNEQGVVKELVDEEKKTHYVVVVRGQYGYIKPDGKPETVNYYADDTGFHADGESVPKPVTR